MGMWSVFESSEHGFSYERSAGCLIEFEGEMFLYIINIYFLALDFTTSFVVVVCLFVLLLEGKLMMVCDIVMKISSKIQKVTDFL